MCVNITNLTCLQLTRTYPVHIKHIKHLAILETVLNQSCFCMHSRLKPLGQIIRCILIQLYVCSLSFFQSKKSPFRPQDIEQLAWNSQVQLKKLIEVILVVDFVIKQLSLYKMEIVQQLNAFNICTGFLIPVLVIKCIVKVQQGIQ